MKRSKKSLISSAYTFAPCATTCGTGGWAVEASVELLRFVGAMAEEAA